MELYFHDPPPGRPIPVEVTPLPVEDSIPREADIVEEVKRLCLDRSGEPSGMRAENLCKWIQEAMREEDPDVSNWEKVVEILQAAFQEGSLSK